MKAVSKVKTKEMITPSFDFPILMETLDKKLFVMFTDVTKGVIVSTESVDHLLGSYSQIWIACTDHTFWTPFTGEITLKNE